MNPLRSKLISLMEHSANPPITGIKDRFTYNPVCSPKNIISRYKNSNRSTNYQKLNCLL